MKFQVFLMKKSKKFTVWKFDKKGEQTSCLKSAGNRKTKRLFLLENNSLSAGFFHSFLDADEIERKQKQAERNNKVTKGNFLKEDEETAILIGQGIASR